MQTIDKAAGLLSHFSETHTEIGLTELARLSGNDKASVRRCLLAFMKHGLIEQNQATKGYRLGREVLRLARVREISFPLIEVTKPLLKYLRDSTGETAHLSVLAGNKLATIAVEDSLYANRINFVLGEESPLHATATGLTILAFSSEEQAALLRPKAEELYVFTNKTPSNDAELQSVIATIRKKGFSLNDGLLEAGLSSMATPIIDSNNEVIAAFGVAAPSTRFNREAQKKCSEYLLRAASDASSAIGRPDIGDS